MNNKQNPILYAIKIIRIEKALIDKLIIEIYIIICTIFAIFKVMSLTSVIPIICLSYVSKITDEKSVIKQVKSITNISANKTVIFVIISSGITIILDATKPIIKYKITDCINEFLFSLELFFLLSKVSFILTISLIFSYSTPKASNRGLNKSKIFKLKKSSISIPLLSLL